MLGGPDSRKKSIKLAILFENDEAMVARRLTTSIYKDSSDRKSGRFCSQRLVKRLVEKRQAFRDPVFKRGNLACKIRVT